MNNASGSLRPLGRLPLRWRLSADDIQRLLNIIYYPSRMFTNILTSRADRARRAAFVRPGHPLAVRHLALAQRCNLRHVEQAFPADYQTLFHELLWEAQAGRPQAYIEAMLDTLTYETRA